MMPTFQCKHCAAFFIRGRHGLCEKCYQQDLLNRSSPPAYRIQIRNLLLPAMYQVNKRGVPFTDEELESVIDVYLTSEAGKKPVLGAVRRRLDELTTLPLMQRKEQANLQRLASISPAYRLSKISARFRAQPEKNYDPRKSTQKANSRALEKARAGWDGRSQSHRDFLASIGCPSPSNRWVGLNATTVSYVTQPLSQPLQTTEWYTEPALPVEIRPGEIVAWRAWYEKDGELYSLNPTTDPAKTWHHKAHPKWIDGKMEGDVETHGVYALRTYEAAREYALGYVGGTSPFDTIAIGEVELWGTVIEHEDGYRASHAQLLAIKERMGWRSFPSPNLRRETSAEDWRFATNHMWACSAFFLLASGFFFVHAWFVAGAAVGIALANAVIACVHLLWRDTE